MTNWVSWYQNDLAAARDDVGGTDSSWNSKACKSFVSTASIPGSYRLDALPDAKLTMSMH